MLGVSQKVKAIIKRNAATKLNL